MGRFTQDDLERLRARQQRTNYKERAHAQMLAWAEGRPYHENVNDECCPDFSCCFPDLYERNDAKRWEQYKNRYGTN